MSDNQDQLRSQASQDESCCIVCFKQAYIFSIGSCNHFCCFECSSRMRCLLLQTECPICRQDNPKVIFTKTIDQFANLDKNTRTGLFEKKYRIVFADLEIQKAFYHLLEHRCPKCDEHKPFVDFNKLKEHVRKTHELFYCEICTENLKLFSSERRCYNRSELAQHRRVGDKNDTSHRGHPRCDYCELRYLDKDELFRHLRREHYYCHLCDADGVNLFYGTIQEMREHFKSEHFLCEEDECVEEEFTAVYRTEIDLKAHKATVHSKSMSRAEARQTRTLDLDFSYGPRGRGGGENFRGRIRTNDTQREFDRIPEQNQQHQQQQLPINIDANSEEQFPSLAGPSVPAQSVQLANSVRHVVYKQSGLAKTSENFPALGGFGPKPQSSNKLAKPSSGNNKPTASSLFKASAAKPAQQKVQEPPAPSNPPKTTINVKRDSINDFPALPQNSNKKKTPARDLMEDMVLPSNNVVDKSIVSSKHRGLMNDYVSIASQMTKVQLVKQKEDTSPTDNAPKSVPKLNSVNNFPSLGSSSAASNNNESNGKVPSWITVKPSGSNQKPPQKSENKNQMVNLNKAVKKANDVPQKNPKLNVNGVKKESGAGKKSNSSEKTNAENKVKAPPGFEKLSNFSRFKPVPEMSKRNQALVEEFEKVLKTNEAMQEFRLLSQMFRDGNYFARSYYESCKHVLGEKFDTLFPELIALLPDIEKQQKLYSIHLKETNNNDDISSKKNSKKSLEVCKTCQQVLLGRDFAPHTQSHELESTFPQLKSGESASVKSKK